MNFTRMSRHSLQRVAKLPLMGYPPETNFSLTAPALLTLAQLAAAVWSLIQNPTYMEKLQREVRCQFRTAEDIKLQNLDNLDFLHAVISETFRMYPPAVAGQPRIAPPAGDFISGYWVPPKVTPGLGYSTCKDADLVRATQTGVQINQYAAYMSRRNFLSRSIFAPSRWLNDAQYAGDKRDVLQPFSVGTRNCIGKK